MKNNLENSFKESLKDFEMPYNAAAWTALSSKLDSKLPTTTPKSNFKWYAIAGTAAVAVTVGAYFFFSNDESSAKTTTDNVVQTVNSSNNKEVQNNENKNVNSNQSSNNSDSGLLIENDGSNEINGSNTQTNNNSSTSSSSNAQATTTTNSNGQQSNSTSQQTSNSNQSGGNQTTNTSVVANEDNINFIAPSMNDLCANEVFDIENENSVKFWILGPQDNDWHAKPKASASFSTNIAGKYQYGYFNKQGFVEVGTFNVKDAPFVDFTINYDQKFENGIPVTKVSTDVPGVSFNWNFGRSSTASGREAEGHFFTKGTYDITLTVTGPNGCSNGKTELFSVEYENGDRGNYNLLAVNAINLRSNDVRNSSFMPEGLKHRDARFKLMIYSMEDGHKVFETNDPMNPWTGVDQSNGQQVSHATTYYWEVILENPMPGENSKYKGSLTVLLN